MHSVIYQRLSQLLKILILRQRRAFSSADQWFVLCRHDHLGFSCHQRFSAVKYVQQEDAHGGQKCPAYHEQDENVSADTSHVTPLQVELGGRKENCIRVEENFNEFAVPFPVHRKHGNEEQRSDAANYNCQ